MTEQDPRLISLAGLPCTECGAAVGEWCRTSGGDIHPSLAHASRLRAVSEHNRAQRTRKP